jgi:predicted RNase H-like nuclease (RuvC/YqgF family)
MKTAALLACLMFTAAVLSSCEEKQTSTASEDVKAYLNDDERDIKRLKNQTEILERRVGELESKMGNLETTMRNLESNTDTSSVTYLERRVAELERKMHVLTTTHR